MFQAFSLNSVVTFIQKWLIDFSTKNTGLDIFLDV